MVPGLLEVSSSEKPKPALAARSTLHRFRFGRFWLSEVQCMFIKFVTFVFEKSCVFHLVGLIIAILLSFISIIDYVPS